MKNLIISSLIITMFALLGFTKHENTSLKAVLIVGPQQDGTDSAIESMDIIAELFKTKGVIVEQFYNEQADWDKIKLASKSANFFVYSGHGSTMGEEGKTGGLCIKSMVSSKNIIEEFKLQNNAIVIFKSVCRGAGSSAGDDGDIGINEALTRVTDYSKPFFEIGAACYYANNVDNGCILFLNEFFLGKCIKDCFEESTKTVTQTTTINGVVKVEQIASPNTKIELLTEYKYDKNKQISIVSNTWEGMLTRTTYTNGVKKVEQIPSSKQYDIAYVANPNFTINDMKQ